MKNGGGGCMNNGNTANPFRLFCTGKREHGPLAKVDKTKQPKEKLPYFSNVFLQKILSCGEDVYPWCGVNEA